NSRTMMRAWPPLHLDGARLEPSEPVVAGRGANGDRRSVARRKYLEPETLVPRIRISDVDEKAPPHTAQRPVLDPVLNLIVRTARGSQLPHRSRARLTCDDSNEVCVEPVSHHGHPL